MLNISWMDFLRRNDWQSMKRYGGGILNNYGAHLIDLALYITSSKVAKISCAMRRVVSVGDADDSVKVLAETESGVVLDIDISRSVAISKPNWSIYGSKGTAVIDEREWETRKFDVKYYREDEVETIALHDEMAAPGRSYVNEEKIPWREEVIQIEDMPTLNFYDKCFEYYALGQPPFVPIEETLEVMRVIAECRKYAEWE